MIALIRNFKHQGKHYYCRHKTTLCHKLVVMHLLDVLCSKLLFIFQWFIRIRGFIPDSWLDFLLDLKYNKGLPKVGSATS